MNITLHMGDIPDQTIYRRTKDSDSIHIISPCHAHCTTAVGQCTDQSFFGVKKKQNAGKVTIRKDCFLVVKNGREESSGTVRTGNFLLDCLALPLP